MQQLSGLDAAFLGRSIHRRPTGTCSVSFLTRPAGGEALTLDRLTELVESLLASGSAVSPPLLSCRGAFRWLDQPYWIEEPEFDIEFHVRELALPAPGDDRQLAAQAARLHARPLDRWRPLWGAVPDPRPAGWPVGPLHEGAPRGDRRGVGKRSARQRCWTPRRSRARSASRRPWRRKPSRGRGAAAGCAARCRWPANPVRAARVSARMVRVHCRRL